MCIEIPFYIDMCTSSCHRLNVCIWYVHVFGGLHFLWGHVNTGQCLVVKICKQHMLIAVFLHQREGSQIVRGTKEESHTLHKV